MHARAIILSVGIAGLLVSGGLLYSHQFDTEADDPSGLTVICTDQKQQVGQIRLSRIGTKLESTTALLNTFQTGRTGELFAQVSSSVGFNDKGQPDSRCNDVVPNQKVLFTFTPPSGIDVDGQPLANTTFESITDSKGEVHLPIRFGLVGTTLIRAEVPGKDSFIIPVTIAQPTGGATGAGTAPAVNRIPASSGTTSSSDAATASSGSTSGSSSTGIQPNTGTTNSGLGTTPQATSTATPGVNNRSAVSALQKVGGPTAGTQLSSPVQAATKTSDQTLAIAATGLIKPTEATIENPTVTATLGGTIPTNIQLAVFRNIGLPYPWRPMNTYQGKFDALRSVNGQITWLDSFIKGSAPMNADGTFVNPWSNATNVWKSPSWSKSGQTWTATVPELGHYFPYSVSYYVFARISNGGPISFAEFDVPPAAPVFDTTKLPPSQKFQTIRFIPCDPDRSGSGKATLSDAIWALKLANGSVPMDAKNLSRFYAAKVTGTVNSTERPVVTTDDAKKLLRIAIGFEPPCPDTEIELTVPAP